ncbi:hypothetical protein CPTD_01654 [Corynebacterium pseudotuberculosis]|nr:hypothetical protein CPTA_02075 [Corynebacterium pseudotuberculosis]AIG09742.1 hypothetical protein CPTB_01686 [Corynebacterium pseudotuberculosis]AIG12360.1 hypothetical protein CPTC_02072 [Corynebacterium pseudotuberculosis]AKC74251.1 Hypothetical protein Cp226_1541 [Corynebacterium pseudotuberculosis]ATQ65831.1 Hypothetical protein CpPA07_1533 [Corynebacterium pseudotuberculosis]
MAFLPLSPKELSDGTKFLAAGVVIAPFFFLDMQHNHFPVAMS